MLRRGDGANSRSFAASAFQSGHECLSDAAGYADQAHMSREARDLTGQPPSSLLAGGGSTLAMADLFKIGDGESR